MGEKSINAALWLLAGIAPTAMCESVANAQGYSLEEAAQRVTTMDGLEVTLFAAEPDVLQPILTTVDDRGRLWTIQYLQYPNPAGLVRVSTDRWSRTVYDRVPEPPPHGPRGADRITILEDVDGDGRADRFKDFVDGLNLATGVAFGHGGVFILQVPYLLFYPDANRDDVPDRNPDVLLSGFGMEDAQSLATHLTWGPDGWLYGVNGSTTTCNIRGIEFQQGVWRYHPRDDHFELFCEGGGNTFGLTFDERGNLFYSTNGGPFIHAMQGAYYRKSFGKHGPLHNLHAYGFFETVATDQIPGGPPTGGTIYLGDRFSNSLRGAFIAGNFLGHAASWWNVASEGSTFTATYGGVMLDAHDTWFGPTDMCAGTDGAMYVSDFHDARTAHPDHDANWDRSNGRIYRIAAPETAAVGGLDIAELSSDELVDLLSHPNRWYADRARVHLAARRDAAVVPRLRAMALQQEDELLALQGLWALHVSAGLDDATALELLAHLNEYMSHWVVRLLGDRRQVSPVIASHLIELAAIETSPVVRCQLAATAKRLPVPDAIPIIDALITAMPDDADSRTPWMIWWAIESHALSGRETLVTLFMNETAWQSSSRRMQAGHLVRRWAAEGTEECYDAAASLIESTPVAYSEQAFASLAEGLSERATQLGDIEQGGLFEQFAPPGSITMGDSPQAEAVSEALLDQVLDYWASQPDDAERLRLALLCESNAAYDQLMELMTSPETDAPSLAEYLGLLNEFGRENCVVAVTATLDRATDDAVRSAAIRVLGRFESEEITNELLTRFPDFSTEVRTQLIDVLLSRPLSARLLLERIADGEIDREAVSVEQLRIVAMHDDEDLNEQVRLMWGNVSAGTPEEKLADMRRFSNDLRAGIGDIERGKAIYRQRCGTCHVLFDEGTRIGPDLTTANRGDQAALLASIVDPGAVVRREYISYTLATTDGRILTGLIAEQDAASLTLLDAKNQRTRVLREDIEELSESDVSLMPERILEQLSPGELRDLFAFLAQSPSAPP